MTNILIVEVKRSMKNEKDYSYYFFLGLPYISAVLKREGYDVDCLNANHYEGTLEDILSKKLDGKKYDYVLSGGLSVDFNIFKRFVNTIRNHKSNPKIILGGTLVSTETDFIFKELKPDYAVIGEGEETIVDLLESISKKEDLSNVYGIVYKHGEWTVKTAPRNIIENLDSLPFPDLDSFGYGEYLSNLKSNSYYNLSDYPRLYFMVASRGCPFSCSFCYHKDRYRIRTIKNVMEELNIAVRKYKINNINLYDDCFSEDVERLKAFCYGMTKLRESISWDVTWCCQLTVRNITDDLLKMLKDAGCVLISYGFESYHPDILKSMRKPITPEKIDNAFKKTLNAGIIPVANFIFGDPKETKETYETTLNYWKDNCKGQVTLWFINPYPESEDYKYCLNNGIIKDKLDFYENNIGKAFNKEINMTKMSDEEFKELKSKIVKYRLKYCGIGKKPILKDHVLEIGCPFCNHRNRYENVYFENERLYDSMFLCRNCNLRYIAMSNLKRLGYSIYPITKFIREKMLKNG